jgi:hypothetical protein
VVAKIARICEGGIFNPRSLTFLLTSSDFKRFWKNLEISGKLSARGKQLVLYLFLLFSENSEHGLSKIATF